MVPKHMLEILDEAWAESMNSSSNIPQALVDTEAIQNLIKYIDNLEAELIVRRTADLPTARVVTIGLEPKENSVGNSLNS